VIRNGHGIILAASLTLLLGGRVARTVAQDKPALPAEELRLDRKKFLDGLERRGLKELIELHLRDFPPSGALSEMLLRRRLKLADYADTSIPLEERRHAIADANRILEKLIQDNPKDPRRFTWLFTLTHSLLYDEGERLFTNILYRGGNEADRRELTSLTERAVEAIHHLSKALEVEFDRVDRLPIDEFAKLERSGYIDEIDRLGPQTQYLLLWTLFYDALPREEQDPRRVRALHEIHDRLSANDPLLETPHEASRVQVPALLLAGMVERRLHNLWSARSYLDRAIAVADRLGDPDQRADVAWAVALASIERIRNERDDGRTENALNGLDSFRKQIDSAEESAFGLRVVAALLERSIHRVQAATAEREGRPQDARRFRTLAWQSLARLAKRHPDRRDEIYATLYSLIEPDADPEALDPLEQCALIASALADAGQRGPEAAALLNRAVAVGKAFLARSAPQARDLRRQVLFNFAVVQYRRGFVADAAERFLNLARDEPDFPKAMQGTVWAVQLSAQLYQDAKAPQHAELAQLYFDALDYLIEQYPDSEAARYWRFYFAQLLDDRNDFERAAAEFARVGPAHEHYIESRYLQLRAMARALTAHSHEPSPDEAAIRRLAAGFFSAQRAFLADAGGNLAKGLDAARLAALHRYADRSRLLTAEVQVLPLIGRHAQALETLKDFERLFPENATVIGRVWRVRLLAYEQLGQFDEAASAIPAYIAADPDNAGPTLQALYLSIVADIHEMEARADQRAEARKAKIALVLARQLMQWDETHDANGDPAAHRAFRVQLAEANLRAGYYEEARTLFESLGAADDGSTVPTEATDLRVAAGYAEALYQIKQFQTALERFNLLAVRLPENDPVRWHALLRDLQCRTALGQPPEGIIQVILQQRQLHPQLGGSVTAAQFDKLQRENQRRLDGS